MKAYRVYLKTCSGLILPNQYFPIVVWKSWGWFTCDFTSWTMLTSWSSLLWTSIAVHDELLLATLHYLHFKAQAYTINCACSTIGSKLVTSVQNLVLSKQLPKADYSNKVAMLIRWGAKLHFRWWSPCVILTNLYRISWFCTMERNEQYHIKFMMHLWSILQVCTIGHCSLLSEGIKTFH